jgi:ZIP family zinc transporter
MTGDLLTVLLVAGAAGAASVAGGLLALWRRPTPLVLSVTLGFASGVLLATITLEMLPQARELGGTAVAAAGFAAGFGATYGLDLFVHRGRIAGARSDKRRQVERFYQAHRPRGGEVTVLAAGTSAEEVLEGLAIGAGAAIQPGLAVLVAAAIAIDNLSEALSIGELIASGEADEAGAADGVPPGGPEPPGERVLDAAGGGGGGSGLARRVLGWTGLIGVVVLASSVVGWLLLRDVPAPLLAVLFAAAGGGMLYLTVTDLIPGGQERQYQQSAALATGAGFLVVLTLSSVT